jgi:hypothetical protein
VIDSTGFTSSGSSSSRSSHVQGWAAAQQAAVVLAAAAAAAAACVQRGCLLCRQHPRACTALAASMCVASKSSFRGCSRCSQQMLELASHASAQRAPGSRMPLADACFAKQRFAHAVLAWYARHSCIRLCQVCSCVLQPYSNTDQPIQQHRPALL